MLALEVEDRPEALELIASIQAAEDHLHQLYEEVRGYAAPLSWSARSRSRRGLAAAWENLALVRKAGKPCFAKRPAGRSALFGGPVPPGTGLSQYPGKRACRLFRSGAHRRGLCRGGMNGHPAVRIVAGCATRSGPQS